MRSETKVQEKSSYSIYLNFSTMNNIGMQPTNTIQNDPSTQKNNDSSYTILVDKPNQITSQGIQKLGNVQFIPAGDIKIGTKLGKGAFGIVYRGEYRGKWVALKALDIEHAQDHLPQLRDENGVYQSMPKADIIEAFEWEVTRLASLKHPNLVQFLGIYTENGMSYMVMEFCEGGTLQNLLDDKKQVLPWAQRWRLALEMTQGLAYLHHHGILHRDLKAENVLIDNEGRVKLADLGVAQVDRLLDDKEVKVVQLNLQDERFRAPEKLDPWLERSTNEMPADVYAFGLVLWQLVTRLEPPAPGHDIHEFRTEILRKARTGEREKIPDDCPDSFRKIMLDCWEINPTRRITMKQLLPRMMNLVDEFFPELLTNQLSKLVQRLDLMLDEQRPELQYYLVPFSTTNYIREDLDTFWRRIEGQEDKENIVSSIAHEIHEIKEQKNVSEINNTKLFQDHRNKKSNDQPIPITQILKQFLTDEHEPVLVILGEAGLGKSLTTYHLVNQLLKTMRNQLSKLEKPVMPVATEVSLPSRELITPDDIKASANDHALLNANVSRLTAEISVPPSDVLSQYSIILDHSAALYPVTHNQDLKKDVTSLLSSSEIKVMHQTENSVNQEVLASHTDFKDWIPIFIRPSISEWKHSQLTQALQKALVFAVNGNPMEEKSSTPVMESLRSQKLLFILDGYDELQADISPQNLPEQLGLIDFPQAKLIIMGRSNLFSEGEHFARFHFKQQYQVHYLLSFRLDQLFHYLSKRLRLDASQQAIYQERFSAAPQLRVVLRNPFVANLFAQSFTTMAKKDFQQLRRSDIYASFIEHWLTQQVKLLDEEVQAQLIYFSTTASSNTLTFSVTGEIQENKPIADVNINTEVEIKAGLLNSFQSFAEQVAFILYKNRVLMSDIASLQSSLSTAQQQWLMLANIVAENGRQKFRAREYQQMLYQVVTPTSSFNRSILNEEDFLRILQLRVQEFLTGCPLKQRSDGVSYLHKSFFEYFVAQAILQAIDHDRINQSSISSQRLREVLSVRSIQDDRGVLSFVLEGDLGPATLRSQHLLTQIQISKLSENEFLTHNSSMTVELKPSSMDKKTEQQQTEKVAALTKLLKLEKKKIDPVFIAFSKVAANAATMLNAAHVSFSELDWNNIRIPGADLSGGIMDSMRLQGADLTDVYLQGTWLRQSNLTGANLTGIRLGEYPGLDLHSSGNACAYSKDGHWLVIGCDDRICIYYIDDKRTLFLFHELQAHTSPVTHIAFSPLGNCIVSLDKEGHVLLWDAKHWYIRRDAFEGVAVNIQNPIVSLGITELKEKITCVTFNSSGDCLVLGSDQHTVHLWNIPAARYEQILRGHTKPVTCVAYSSQAGNELASGSEDHSIRLWDAKTEHCKRVLLGHTDIVTSVVFSPNGDTLASGSCDRVIYLWEVKSGRCIAQLSGHTAEITSVKFSLGGDRLTSGSIDHTVRLWDAKSGRHQTTFKGHTNGVTDVAFDSTGYYVVSVSRDGSAHLWDAKSENCLQERQGHTKIVTSVIFRLNGNQVVSGSWDGSIRFWNTQSGHCELKFERHSKIISVAISPSGDQLISASTNGLRLWDINSEICKAQFNEHTAAITSAAFLDDDHVVSGSADKTIRLWNIKQKHCVAEMKGHTRSVTSITCGSNGARLASGSNDGSVRIWDAKSGRCEIELKTERKGKITSVAFNPNDNLIAAGSSDSSIRLWDAKLGKRVGKLKGHTDLVTSIVFRQSGDRLASGSEDRSVRLWDVKTGKCLMVIPNLPSIVTSVSWYSTDSQSYLAIGSTDHAVRVFKIIEMGTRRNSRLFAVLHWSSETGTLMVSDICLRNVIGLSADNKELLKQRGAGDKIKLLQYQEAKENQDAKTTRHRTQTDVGIFAKPEDQQIFEEKIARKSIADVDHKKQKASPKAYSINQLYKLFKQPKLSVDGPKSISAPTNQ